MLQQDFSVSKLKILIWTAVTFTVAAEQHMARGIGIGIG
jgi:hypothetical protein